MHGTGLFVAMSVLSSAGSVVMPQNRSFNPVELLDDLLSGRCPDHNPELSRRSHLPP